jgi:UDP-N-acetylglucosamine 1-carboxyvinyltransferase
MSKFIIQGGLPLNGVYKPLGNKNAVLPMLAASLLTEEPVTLHHVPWIDDVRVMLDLLEDLGVQLSIHERSITLCANNLRKRRLNQAMCKRVRSSILLAGPLVARHGEATLYPPGGDIIGRRRVDTHFDGLQALGIQARAGQTYRLKRTAAFKGADMLLDEASVTGTENLLMAATLAPGRTTIYNAACEPHVQDLATLLNAMGARIEGIGTNRISVTGVKTLRGADYVVQPDHIELGSFMAAAACTGGRLEALYADKHYSLRILERVFERLGIRWKTTRKGIVLQPGSLRIKTDIGSAIPKIEDGPWPAFPSDLMSVAIVTATQTEGSVLFFEKMFESRMYFVDQLISMGARIVQCDPHRVVVHGPSPLHRAHMATPDIRAGMALLIAALCAKGRSTIENASIIDRGYERIDDRLRELGADIERVD